MRYCVFLGSSPGLLPAYRDAAVALSRALTSRNIGIVYGGNSLGLMGALSDTALALDADIAGVIPRSIAEAAAAQTKLKELHLVDTMHERKALMARLSDAFIVLPGGLGTLEEFFEIWTWAKLGFHAKPVGVLNVAGYFDRLFDFLGFVEQQGFMARPDRDLIFLSDSIEELIDKVSERLAA